MLKKIWMFVGIALCFVGSPAIAQEEGEGGKSCFYCVDDGEAGYPRHCDMVLDFGEDYKGTKHPDCRNGYADGVCSQHTAYGGAQNRASAILLRKSDDELLRLLAEDVNVTLNIERSAIQVADSRGDIVLHQRLDLQQTKRLRVALEAHVAELC